jgi:hypothetical protein
VSGECLTHTVYSSLWYNTGTTEEFLFCSMKMKVTIYFSELYKSSTLVIMARQSHTRFNEESELKLTRSRSPPSQPPLYN